MINSQRILKQISSNVEQVIIGKRNVIQLVLLALISKGHVLIEDVPGTGKTSLVTAFARSVNCSYNRIQFTPDVTPSDVIGFSMYNRKTSEFEFKPGAVFTQFLLADEINRTSSKTQSSLLEVMEEQQVSVDSVTYEIPSPFIVFATQNPIEYVGTFPLPEAQLDRFFMKISIGYPSHEQEMEILKLHKNDMPVNNLNSVATAEDIIHMQEMVQTIHMDDKVSNYIIRLINGTRNHPDLLLGGSPRASIYLSKAAKSYAFMCNRDFVIPEDVKAVAPYIIPHRLRLTQEAKYKNIQANDILLDIMKETEVMV